MAAKMMMRCMAVAFAAMMIAASSARADESFNVRFSWKLKGEYAPFYLAQQKGMFAKEGLTVRLGEGAGSEAALGSLLQGNEDVVIIPGIYALSAISKGMPVQLVSLIQPVAPAGIVSHPEKPIATPQDLEGKSLAATVGDTTMDYLKVLCSQNHIDCAKIKIVMMNVQARLPQFMSKQVDGMSTYWNIDLPQLEYTSKEKFVLLDVGKYGERVPGLLRGRQRCRDRKQPGQAEALPARHERRVRRDERRCRCSHSSAAERVAGGSAASRCRGPGQTFQPDLSGHPRQAAWLDRRQCHRRGIGPSQRVRDKSAKQSR